MKDLLRRWWYALFPPSKPLCPYGCNDKLHVTERGGLYRSTRSLVYKGCCPIHDKVKR